MRLHPNKPLFSLCHTTARLPDGWRAAAQAWFDNSVNPHLVEHVITTDELIKIDPIFPNTVIGVNDGPKTAVAGWNLSYRLSSGKFIISLADDWFPCPKWDAEIFKVLQGDFDGHHVLEVDTGGNPSILTFTLATRSYLQRYNGGSDWMFYPEYIGMYADNDFTLAAIHDRVIIPAKHLKFPHHHPSYSKEFKTDDIHRRQHRAEAWQVGTDVYKRRLAERGIKPKPIMVVCLPGEHFSSTWVAYWTSLCTSLAANFTVSPLFAFSSNVHVTRACMWNQILGSVPLPDYVLWIDDDNLVTPPDLKRLFDDLEEHPEADMVAGWSWCVPDVYDGPEAIVSCGRVDNRAMKYTDLMAGAELKEVGYTGFPAVLHRGSMLHKAGLNPFLPVIDPNHVYGFLSEDKSFCFHARENGCRLFVDRRVKVPHLKLRDAEPRHIPEVPVEADLSFKPRMETVAV
jgi:hypothetical protein